jgi:hypothetical protein
LLTRRDYIRRFKGGVDLEVRRMKKLGRAFLVLIAGLVSGLAVATAAAGSQAQVTQKALEAPRPTAVRRKTGGIGQVACSSAKSCAAAGQWLYTDLSGKWQATRLASVAQAGNAILLSLSCPAAGRCEGVGIAGEQHAVHVSESGRAWQAGAADLPPDAAPVDSPAGPSPVLYSVSCASAGNCVAAGRYTGADRMSHPLLDTEDAGTWSAGFEPQLPANADTSPDPNRPGLGGNLTLVSCPAPGNCTAVGSYTNKDSDHSYYPWVTTESGGLWAPGSEALLPADAAALGNTVSGASPFFGFTGLSCPSAGNCTAIGGYEDTNGAEEGLILSERDGVWSQAVRAPLPPKAVPQIEASEFSTPITSLSCAAPDDCAAVGWYVFHSLAKPHGWLLSERNGKWKASAVVLPAGAKASDAVTLHSVACPSRGNCVAVGEYFPVPGKARALVVRERGGKWGRAVNAALPKSAAAASKAHSYLYSVSCPSAKECTAGGNFTDRSSRRQGLFLRLRLG